MTPEASTITSRAKTDGYRPDIDGLRAVSVVAVILFHTGLACPGGYVGVDVFFVISGFLITGLIVKDLEKGHFSLVDFWLRRARRILPAVFVVTLATLGLGYWLLMPYHLIQMAKSSIAQSFFASNFFFWRDRSYFNQESEWKPLLHTWSLSVEEQFYLVLPFFLYIIYRWNKRWMFAAVLAVASASFLLSCRTITASPAATFFLLPTRAWELLAGSLLVGLNRRSFSLIVSEFISIFGFLLIMTSVFTYDRNTEFPGLLAVVPVLGTMLVLLANESHVTLIEGLLSLPALVWLGKISFSLYLWHWPLLSVSRYAFDGQLSVPAIAIVLIFTLGFSWLTYSIIEQPIRRRKVLASNKTLVVTLIFAWIIITVVSFQIYRYEGFPSRSSRAEIPSQNTFLLPEIQAIREKNLPFLGDRTHSKPSFIVWGDSHAATAMPMISELASNHGISGLGAAMSSSPPLPDTKNGWNKDLIEWNTRVLNLIEEKDIQHVFLIARWSSYIEKVADYDLLLGTDPLQTLAYDDQTLSKTPDEAFKAFDRSICSLSERLTKAGRHVFLVLQVPEQKSSPPRSYFTAERTWGWIPNRQVGIDRNTHESRQRRVNEVFYSLASPLVTIVPSDQLLFGSDNRTILVNEKKLIYNDTNHLTIEGTRFALAPLLEPIFDTIANQ
ncbi:MAG: acyltransferase family protein [Planctomycetota bacterium]|nr:acyltransferase family protein [Planctomycetota bacterium]